MKSYHINLGAGLDGLVLKEHDIPVPGSREVLIRVRACSLNSRELMILIQGSYPLGQARLWRLVQTSVAPRWVIES